MSAFANGAWRFCLAMLLILALERTARADDAAESYADVHARAAQLDGTPEGKAYGPVFSKALAPVIVDAIRDCVANAKPPDAINLVLVLDASGGVRRAIPEPWQPVAACVTGRLGSVKFPPPPRSNWPVFVSIAVK